ncbi:MAG TPA: TetR family transcriptional regulator [Marmoricola sp.]|jgi:AcrR family transcriptional regulator|nr:TetR family transcriptional regulator [Marmoricola sp.]
MAYDAAATRRRLLDAAYEEFAAHGLAGARVDQIAATASANKQAIYAYFGSKDDLFDAVLADRMSVLADAAPFTPDDLPGYAGALFDALNSSPEVLRLARWRSLERADVAPTEVASHLEKARAARHALGIADDRTAVDVIELVVALASTWSTIPDGLRAVGRTSKAARQRAHRMLVVGAVRALVEALPTS